MKFRNLPSLVPCPVLVSVRVNHFNVLVITLDLMWILTVLSVVGVVALARHALINVHNSEVSIGRDCDLLLHLHRCHLIFEHASCKRCFSLWDYLVVILEEFILDFEGVSVEVFVDTETSHYQSPL